jgi:hypothetical protein
LNPKGNPNIHEEARKAGVQFSSTNQPANPGRKPNAIKAFAAENDLSLNDVTNAIKHLANLTEEEVKKISGDSNTPILVKGFAKALLTELEKGGLMNLELLISRTFGKAKESVEVTGDIAYEIKPAPKKSDVQSKG